MLAFADHPSRCISIEMESFIIGLDEMSRSGRTEMTMIMKRRLNEEKQRRIGSRREVTIEGSMVLRNTGENISHIFYYFGDLHPRWSLWVLVTPTILKRNIFKIILFLCIYRAGTE
ncbi:uncharacterized protein LOC122571312 [Bombus pyrosoma]|uniref:uncharacterized protein LOC122571312 n=1 Tax=Bombus pyrosoma TaxID=396416 RepID=UPI001CB9281C|nr:uncharacterized protein LOC122571312 [Bombus pyrosoma]